MENYHAKFMKEMNRINGDLEENLKRIQEICVKYDIPVSDKVLTDEELNERIDSLYKKVMNHD